MIYLIAILVYLCVLTALGVYKSRQVKTEDDFVVAGRTLSPWNMVLTMLAVWIGTGSILGNAEQTYRTGAAALIIPFGTFAGMILLALIATRARDIKVSTVPEIIGARYGWAARLLAVTSLVIAYMVIVSYQFNAGGAVLEVIAGTKPPVALAVGDRLTRTQLAKGRAVFTPEPGFAGETSLTVAPQGEPQQGLAHPIVVALSDRTYPVRYPVKSIRSSSYAITDLPPHGHLELIEPRLTKETATVVAAAFIIAYAMLAGLMSLAFTDIVTGVIIITSLVIGFPLLLVKAGGLEGVRTAFAAMPDKAGHMKVWGVYSATDIINFLLPTFLLVMGDANQYQRIFASRNAKGARQAVTAMIFVALAIELLIIASAWVASSLVPNPENGRYILIYAAKYYMPLVFGTVFMVAVVGIIISTADSFLLVPATTFIKDVYLQYLQPQASEKKVLLLSRLLVVIFGIVAWLVTYAFAETTGFFRKALYAYTIYGASITPCLVAAMFWKRATTTGAISSIVAGTAVTLLWSTESVKSLLPENLLGLDAVLPAITISVLALIAGSLLTEPQKAPAETQAPTGTGLQAQQE
jgi:Na+/proline symporter